MVCIIRARYNGYGTMWNIYAESAEDRPILQPLAVTYDKTNYLVPEEKARTLPLRKPRLADNL